MLFHHKGAVTTSYDGEKSTLEWKFNRRRISVAQAVEGLTVERNVASSFFIHFGSPGFPSYNYCNFTLGNSNPR